MLARTQTRILLPSSCEQTNKIKPLAFLPQRRMQSRSFEAQLLWPRYIRRSDIWFNNIWCNAIRPRVYFCDTELCLCSSCSDRRQLVSLSCLSQFFFSLDRHRDVLRLKEIHPNNQSFCNSEVNSRGETSFTFILTWAVFQLLSYWVTDVKLKLGIGLEPKKLPKQCLTVESIVEMIISLARPSLAAIVHCWHLAMEFFSLTKDEGSNRPLW